MYIFIEYFFCSFFFMERTGHLLALLLKVFSAFKVFKVFKVIKDHNANLLLTPSLQGWFVI